MFDEQVARIREKLDRARASDAKLEVFGSRSHRYRLGRCLSSEAIRSLEKRYGVELPADYKAFIEKVGNGGSWRRRTGAGPYYGLHPLEPVLKHGVCLKEPVCITPDMTDQEWSALIAPLESGDIDGDQYEERLFSGLLTIGDQGCSFSYAIVLNGEHKGRVVNLDDEFDKPFFAYEQNFLDWYERWLDEIIDGGLREPGTWFGLTMGGDDKHLINVYQSAEQEHLKLAAIEGFAKLKSIDTESGQFLRRLCETESGELRLAAIRMLTKFETPWATPHLRNLIDQDDDSCRHACQSIRWYAPNHAQAWQYQLTKRLVQTNDPKTFRFIVYVLQDASEMQNEFVEFGESLTTSIGSPNVEIRVTAIWALGSLKTKANYIEPFVRGLNDQSPKVVHAALQALKGVTDKRLLASYYQICERFETDVQYVLTNLDHRLRENGFRNRDHFLKNFRPSGRY